MKSDEVVQAIKNTVKIDICSSIFGKNTGPFKALASDTFMSFFAPLFTNGCIYESYENLTQNII